MKMPRRPFFPSPIPPDIFGLQQHTVLGQAGESDEDRRKRIAVVEAGVAVVFKAAAGHLGDEQARELFKRVLRRSKRGKGKAFAPDRDTRLLKEYDAAVQNGETIAALAKRLRHGGPELGNTTAAIAAQIRKLVAERKKQERAGAVEARRWRMATYRDPPSILLAAPREK